MDLTGKKNIFHKFARNAIIFLFFPQRIQCNRFIEPKIGFRSEITITLNMWIIITFVRIDANIDEMKATKNA